MRQTPDPATSDPATSDPATSDPLPAAPIAQHAATPFHDLDAYVALPRVSGLVLSPDGTRLVTAVATPDPKGATYVTALWEVDPGGERPAHRLTRSAKGESGAAFTPDGSLLFVSSRPDPQHTGGDGDDDTKTLWLLPAGGGEARVVGRRPGGVCGVVVSQGSGTVGVLSATLPAAVTAEDDEARRKRRKDAGISAILHDSYPVRYWDHDLGPDQNRLLVGALPPGTGAGDGPDGAIAWRDVTPVPGRSLDDASFDLSPDGALVVTTWAVPERGGRRSSAVLVDLASGARRLLVDDPEWEFARPRVSPDGARIALIAERRTTATRPPLVRLEVVDVATGERHDVAPGWDRWPSDVVWVPDGDALVVTADEQGAAPLFRVDVASGAVIRLTGDRAAYSDPQVSPDGSAVFALRAAVAAPSAPVRLAADAADQTPLPLRGPAPAPALPGALSEVEAVAADGTPLRAWLVLPEGSDAQAPAPLLLWIHGGPLASWNTWSWRWNPWLAAARGYAVLLPDPALSTGYGAGMIERGWGRWGEEPYTDLLTITDAALARDDLDADRTAAMGGSFGGYLANWVAGHTDRFRGIVTHASLWALDQFGPTTDAYHYWRREMTPQMALAHSPHRFVERIRTPMLVVHGDKDYRVPVGEGLRLWAELAEAAGDEDGVLPHRFLYFPHENHWVLTPGHAKVWYETVFAFLRMTVHGEEWVVPDLLR